MKIVFLHAPAWVPVEIVAQAQALCPAGACLQPLPQDSERAARAAALADADVVFAYPGDPSADEIAGSRRLRLFQLLSAGHDWLDLDMFRRAGVTVAGNGGANAGSTAEHALLLMLALLKRLPLHHAATARGDWLGMRETMRMRELRGRTVGLLGFGQIGAEVGRLAHAFGARILYHTRRRAESAVEAICDAQHVGFDVLLADSEILSLHAPLSPRTRGIINAAAIDLMQPGALLVNTARGALVDEAAVAAALTDGRLGGAGIDVFSVEPPPAGSPLLKAPNVVLTPHIGGVTVDTWQRRLERAFENALRVMHGEPPRWRIA